MTAGHGTDELAKRFEAEHDEYNAIMTKALADRLAEAFAECLHARARREWGYGTDERLSNDDLIRERYRGIRPAPGYPATPDHTEKPVLFDLLDAREATGIELTENFAMWPAASVCGLYLANPAARYFAVSAVGRDQVVPLRRTKGNDRDGGGAVARSGAGVRSGWSVRQSLGGTAAYSGFPTSLSRYSRAIRAA